MEERGRNQLDDNTKTEAPADKLDFFGPEWHSLCSLPFKGQKVSIFRAPPLSNAPCKEWCPNQNHYVPRHINNRYINSYPGVVGGFMLYGVYL
jgi:hypothetical protein